MGDITLHFEVEKWGGKWDVSDGEDIEHTADTLAEAYLCLAKMLHERGDGLFAVAMGELQKRINELD